MIAYIALCLAVDNLGFGLVKTIGYLTGHPSPGL